MRISFIDISNKKFGRLSVVSRANTNKDKRAWWNCVCDCGKEVIVEGKN